MPHAERKGFSILIQFDFGVILSLKDVFRFIGKQKFLIKERAMRVYFIFCFFPI